MVTVGKPPYLECSSQGDTRFSAFHARPKSIAPYTIEEFYQGMKVFPDGRYGLSWRQAKGHRAVNHDDCAAVYRQLWQEWVEQERLLPVLKAASGLSDVYGQKGHVCQALTLWEIRNA
jgi:hypothetical protein